MQKVLQYISFLQHFASLLTEKLIEVERHLNPSPLLYHHQYVQMQSEELLWTTGDHCVETYGMRVKGGTQNPAQTNMLVPPPLCM